ncbi:MAG: YfiR family protein [Pseudomonadota bacterium]
MSPEMSRISPLLPLRCLLAVLLCMLLGAAQAQAPGPALERQVKAAYLFKFASFVEWPESSFARPDSALHIGVAGSDLLAEQLERMVAGRTVNGHPVKVRRLQAGDALADLHILFIDNSFERGAMAAMLNAARGQSLLTVSDAGDALALGCMISFVVADDKLRFDVALRYVSSSRLRISARMLAVAHRVQGAT